MPIYEYRCSSCAFQKEHLRKVSDPLLTDCPECGKSTYQKQLTAAGFQLKGSGWYATDFKGGSAAATAKAGAKEGGSDSAGSKESGSAESGSKDSGSKDSGAKDSGSKDSGAKAKESGAAKPAAAPAVSSPASPPSTNS